MYSSPVLAANPTYTVSDGVITIKGTDYGTATIGKGKLVSDIKTCTPVGGVSSSKLNITISKEVRDKIDKGERPSSIAYSANADSPTAPGECRKGGKASYGSPPSSTTTDSLASVTAMQQAQAKSLLESTPELKGKDYSGKLSPQEINDAIASCIVVAQSKSAPSSSMGYTDGTQDTPSALLNQHFADCYSEKSGKSAADIKGLLDSKDNPLKKAIDDGEAARSEKAAEEEQTTSCGTEVSGIGWIVCPVINAVSTLNDGMWNIIEGLLTADPLDQGSPMYDLWKILRNIANTLLVVGFIIIVYSQMTGIGVSNYGIKRTLPRLIIVAIAINLSFFIVTIAVDLFNIMGSALHSMLNDIYNGLNLGSNFNWESLAGLIISGGATATVGVAGAAIAGGVTTLFLLMLPTALVSLLGFLAALLTLMFRQAIIPLLAILAPLAFVAYLLPNTESLFTKWRKMFTSMLMLYPLAALLFGGMKVAGGTIAASGADDGKVFALLTGLIVMAAPLFMLPFLAKQSGAMLGAINGKLQGLAGKAKKPFAEWNKGNVDKARSRYDAKDIRYNKDGKPIMRDRIRSMRRNSQYRQRKNELISAAYGKQADAKFNEKFADEAEGLAAGLGGSESVAGRYIDTIGATKASQAEEEEVKQILTKFKSKNPAGEGAIKAADTGLREAIAGGQVAKARAMQQYLMSSGSPGTKALNDVYSDSSISGPDGALNKGMDKEKGVEGEMYRSLSADGLNSGVKSQSAALDKYFTTGSGSNFKDIKNDSDTYNKLNAVELASQKDLGKLIDKKKITADMAAGIMTSDAAVSKLSLENKDKVIDLAQHSKYNVQTPSSNQNSNQNGP